MALDRGGMPALPSIRALASGLPPQARPRPTRLAEPVRAIVRDELRRARLSRSQVLGVAVAGAAASDPAEVRLVYDAAGRLAEAYSRGARFAFEWHGRCTLYRVTEERADGREVVWTFERDARGRVVRAVPVVRDRVAEEIEA